MAELISRNRLQPALLDRLTDLHPECASESRDRRVISLRQLREGVLRDITHVLNSRRLYGADLHAYSAVADSVLNAGLPDFAGRPASNVDKTVLAEEIAGTLRRFEPRILADSLRVSPVLGTSDTRGNVVAFLVEGDLWAQPYPERLYLMTELDLEDGQISISEGHARA